MSIILLSHYGVQGCQNRDFTSSRKGIAKSQSKSKDFKDFCIIDIGWQNRDS